MTNNKIIISKVNKKTAESYNKFMNKKLLVNMCCNLSDSGVRFVIVEKKATMLLSLLILMTSDKPVTTVKMTLETKTKCL